MDSKVSWIVLLMTDLPLAKTASRFPRRMLGISQKVKSVVSGPALWTSLWYLSSIHGNRMLD